MPVYSATFSAVAVSAAQDLFEIVAPSTARVLIREIVAAQYSDAGDSEDEMLSMLLIRGNTTSGTGGASVTPGQFDPYGRAAASTVERNNTTVASAGSPVTLYADAFNVRAGFYWRASNYGQGQYASQFGILLQPSQRFVARITVPADALTMNGTLVFEEVAKAPVS